MAILLFITYYVQKTFSWHMRISLECVKYFNLRTCCKIMDFISHWMSTVQVFCFTLICICLVKCGQTGQPNLTAIPAIKLSAIRLSKSGFDLNLKWYLEGFVGQFSQIIWSAADFCSGFIIQNIGGLFHFSSSHSGQLQYGLVLPFFPLPHLWLISVD